MICCPKAKKKNICNDSAKITDKYTEKRGKTSGNEWNDEISVEFYI